jgi:hypothetical protein
MYFFIFYITKYKPSILNKVPRVKGQMNNGTATNLWLVRSCMLETVFTWKSVADGDIHGNYMKTKKEGSGKKLEINKK